MKKIKINKFPEFNSIAEEAEFWDTHDFSDYWHLGKNIARLPDASNTRGFGFVGTIDKNCSYLMRKIKGTTSPARSGFALSSSLK